MDEKKATNDSSPVSFNVLMEDRTVNPGDEAENFDEAFTCCVCLDLLYKPVVLACGHISCFWCIFRAMDSFGKSSCPICRCPYNHFPSICQLLHFLLLKMYPIAYKRREKQVLEEEKAVGFFSPQFSDQLTCSHTCKESDFEVSHSTSSITCSQTISCLDTCSTGKINPSKIAQQQNSDALLPNNTRNVQGETNVGNFEATGNLSVEDDIFSENNLKDGACNPVTINNLLCVACKQLLFRPVVLNCGHVYCESCIVTPMTVKLICQVCQSSHPKGFPNVCWELHHLLKEQFSQEYALRKEAVQQGIQAACVSGATQITKNDTKSSSSPTQSISWLDECRKFHLGVGCDYCGIYPIIGKRYKCKDCVEKMGFDLCGDCYNSHSKLPGRFNQQHTPEHTFELVDSTLVRNILFRLVAEQSEDDSPVHTLSDGASEDQEDAHAAHSLSDDALEDLPGPNSTI